MVLMRGLAAMAAVVLIAASAAGCSGLSQADADSRCNQEKAIKGACFDDNVFKMCESCFERCGDSCVPQSTTCPVQYLCPGDTLLDAGSDAL